MFSSGHKIEMMPETPGTKRVRNRRAVYKDEVEVRNRIDRSNEFEISFETYSNNIHLSKEALKEAVKGSFKPCASVGLFTGVLQLTKTIDNKDVEPFADAGLLDAGAGVVKDGIGQTYYARASAVEARAGFGNLASIKASALSAGAHAEYYGLTDMLSVGADACVVRLEGNLGPVQAGVGLNFDTHASIGVNGVSASFLGMGFSIGNRLAIQTPFFDFSVTYF